MGIALGSDLASTDCPVRLGTTSADLTAPDATIGPPIVGTTSSQFASFLDKKSMERGFAQEAWVVWYHHGRRKTFY